MPTSVYVHFPWCLQKCPYCDFASATIRRPEVPHAAYADSVLAELTWRRDALAGQTLASVFFGGGTPSLWQAEAIGAVIAAIRGACGAEVPELEVTVECNPSSLDRQSARALAAVGVTRLSIGTQSLDDEQLRFLGRLHDARGALRAIEDALAEVPRVSADLIFGLPGQEPAVAAEHARILARLGLRHVSAYALTIEPGTQFGALHQKGRLPLAREEHVAAAFQQVEAALGEHGLEHYEVSSYGASGERSRHNQHYWRGGAYLGLGAGAVGCLHARPGDARRYRNDPAPERYSARSTSSEVEVSSEALGAQELIREQLMLGLRTSDGVDLARAAALSGTDPLSGRESALARALARGDVLRDGNALRVPHARWLHLDAIVSRLF
jgi:oxygen-independent coproporphyrinogen-3 oxidase